MEQLIQNTASVGIRKVENGFIVNISGEYQVEQQTEVPGILTAGSNTRWRDKTYVTATYAEALKVLQDQSPFNEA